MKKLPKLFKEKSPKINSLGLEIIRGRKYGQ
jgi:hypothetical protein